MSEPIMICENGVMRPATEEEIAAIEAGNVNHITNILPKRVRQQRNLLLQNSDWTQIPDCTADKQAWAEYRQALRDITAQPGFPTDVQWPTAPGVK